jgi:hypothetical protein
MVGSSDQDRHHDRVPRKQSEDASTMAHLRPLKPVKKLREMCLIPNE